MLATIKYLSFRPISWLDGFPWTWQHHDVFLTAWVPQAAPYTHMLSRFLWHHLWSSWHDENPVIMHFPKHSMPGPDVCLHTAAVMVSTETLKKVTIRQRWRGTGTGSAAHPVPGLTKTSPFILVLAVCTRARVWVSEEVIGRIFWSQRRFRNHLSWVCRTELRSSARDPCP